MVAVRKVIHVDMDAFYASVEQRDEPSYRGKPVVVGGTPDQRGVVAAASYEARQFGIYSAMPSFTALKRCPQVIFVRPRFDVYREISRQIRDIFHDFTDLVEPLSLDEAYLDVTSNKRGLPSATLIAKEIKQRIFAETQLTASAGVSINKFLAKTASAINKPDGLTVITPEKAEAFLEKLSIEDFYGVGKVTAEKMRNLGIMTGADLKSWSEMDLVRNFGKVGAFYFQIVRGNDYREVTPNRITKSIGAEESFAVDLKDRHAMADALKEIADTLQRRIEEHKTGGRTLTLKVKYGDYQQVTRSRTFAESIHHSSDMLDAALELLDSTQVEHRNARLLGLQVSQLDCERDPDQPTQLTISFD